MRSDVDPDEVSWLFKIQALREIPRRARASQRIPPDNRILSAPSYPMGLLDGRWSLISALFIVRGLGPVMPITTAVCDGRYRACRASKRPSVSEFVAISVSISRSPPPCLCCRSLENASGPKASQHRVRLGHSAMSAQSHLITACPTSAKSRHRSNIFIQSPRRRGIFQPCLDSD